MSYQGIGIDSGARTNYVSPAGAKSPAGFGDPRESRRTSAHQNSETGAFFVPAALLNGGCAWETFGSAGFLDSRFANPRTAAPNHCLATAGDGSTNQGAVTMKVRLPAAGKKPARAAAHRAMARSALFSDSSLSVRLDRYNHHMSKARQLEGREVRS